MYKEPQQQILWKHKQLEWKFKTKVDKFKNESTNAAIRIGRIKVDKWIIKSAKIKFDES